MEYIHIRSLEKYHPGYKDRVLQWGKIHFKMVQGDPDCEMIANEIDWARLIKMILLELEAQKPLPNIGTYWTRKGFDIKKRPISLTLQMLHNFIEIHTDEKRNLCIDKDKEEDKEKIKSRDVCVTDFFDYYLLKTKKSYKLTTEKTDLIKKRLSDGFTLDQMKKVVDNFVADEWDGRQAHLDLVYCIGKQKGKPDNLEKWLNVTEKKEGSQWIKRQ